MVGAVDVEPVAASVCKDGSRAPARHAVRGARRSLLNGIRGRYRSLLVALLALGALFGASSAWGHNASVHRDMTERAWKIMTGLARDQLDAPSDPATLALAAAAKSAIRKLQGLPADLPPPKQTSARTSTSSGPGAMHRRPRRHRYRSDGDAVRRVPAVTASISP